MPTERTPPRRKKVWEDFRARPWRYDFWQALALTRKLYPGRRVRFKVPPRLHFAPTAVAGLDQAEGGQPVLKVNLIGLAGPEAPMPLWLAELAEGLSIRGDPALAEFLNIFQDCHLNLHQELMTRLKPECDSEGGPALDKYFLAAAGVLTEGIRGRTLAIPCTGPQGDQPGKLPEASFLSAAAIWGMQPRSASGLEFLVEHVFGVKAKVEPLKGAWVELPDEHRCCLGQKKNQLGVDTISGGHVFDPAAGFTLKLGPLTLEQYRSFLPPPAGTLHQNLMVLVSWYTGKNINRQLMTSITLNTEI